MKYVFMLLASAVVAMAQGEVLAGWPIPRFNHSVAGYQFVLGGGADPTRQTQDHPSLWRYADGVFIMHSENLGLCAIVHKFQHGCDFIGRFITEDSLDPTIATVTIDSKAEVIYGRLTGTLTFIDPSRKHWRYKDVPAVFTMSVDKDTPDSSALGGGNLLVETP